MNAGKSRLSMTVFAVVALLWGIGFAPVAAQDDSASVFRGYEYGIYNFTDQFANLEDVPWCLPNTYATNLEREPYAAVQIHFPEVTEHVCVEMDVDHSLILSGHVGHHGDKVTGGMIPIMLGWDAEANYVVVLEEFQGTLLVVHDDWALDMWHTQHDMNTDEHIHVVDDDWVPSFIGSNQPDVMRYYLPN